MSHTVHTVKPSDIQWFGPVSVNVGWLTPCLSLTLKFLAVTTNHALICSVKSPWVISQTLCPRFCFYEPVQTKKELLQDDSSVWHKVILIGYQRTNKFCYYITTYSRYDHCKPVSEAPVLLFFSVTLSATGSALACPIGLCNVLCTWVSSAALSQVFVQASCRQPAVYLSTTITMCFAELFLDVMLLCFVLQQLKIHPYLAGQGLQIRSVLFLIRVCKWCYCAV